MQDFKYHANCRVSCSAEWLYLGSSGHSGLCGNSWVTKDEFYAGLAAAQAMPGPLFNFAAYLGTLSLPCSLARCLIV